MAPLLLWLAMGPEAQACTPQGTPLVISSPILDGPITLRGKDGTRYRLAGVSPSSSAKGGDMEQLLASILPREDSLKVMVLGEADRYQRLPIALSLKGEDLSIGLLRQGYARLDTATGKHPCHADLLRAETEALLGGHHPLLKATDKEALARATGREIIARGRVLSVRKAGRITYINFGRRESGALTAIIRDRNLAALLREGLDPEGLKGQDILVIGKLVMTRGPQIDIEKAESLRIAAMKTSQHTPK